MIIKGTEKIARKTISLASVNLQVKNGNSFYVDETSFWNTDVQTALKMGYIEAVKDDVKKSRKADDDDLVECENIYHKKLFISVLNEEIIPGQKFTLTVRQVRSNDINTAIQNGLIRIVKSVTIEDHTEGFMKIGKIFEDEMATKKTEMNSQLDSFRKKIKERLSELSLETNEDLPKMNKIIDDSTKTEVVTWNPTGSKPIKTAKTKVKKGETTVSVLAAREDSEDKRKNTIVVTPNNEEIMQLSNVAEIVFVDDRADRIKSHPVLSKMSPVIEEINDPIAPDSLDENRIAKHPVLSQQKETKIENDPFVA